MTAMMSGREDEMDQPTATPEVADAPKRVVE